MIRDVVLSKLHSAVLTMDPVSNLYVCGIGRGGRLGLGDENTRFTYTAVQGPLADKRVVQVALGLNHSVAIDDAGALWTWGNNAYSQLGYALPPPAKKDEDPISTIPRQVFGALKKEVILGVAASSIHSVAHTGTSLYCWGKNLGQLALMDADSRSLEIQQTPRKVAASLFSSPIVMVSAIDKATTILLQNHTVCVFTGYGYHIVKFPFAGIDAVANLSMSTRYEAGRNQIQYITSGGETIAALTGRGDLFTMNLDHKIEANPPATSTTNPSKLKGAVTQPQCIWSARKDGVRSVGVGEHGSVIISTQSGAVWRRIKRAKAKDAYTGTSETKRKDFKFQRVPYITNVATVRASTFGTFAAIQQDSDVMKEQLAIDEQSLWNDVAPLNCLEGFKASEPDKDRKASLKFWSAEFLAQSLGAKAHEILRSPDLESDLQQHLTSWAYRNEPLDVAVCTSFSPDLQVPVHGWLLSARSSVLRNALAQFRKTASYSHPDEAFTISDNGGKIVILFQGLDLISLLNLVHFVYEDRVIPAWNFTRGAPSLTYRYRQIRTEVIRLATCLQIGNLEAAARLQTEAKRSMDQDFRTAIKDRRFFEDGDALLELDGLEVPVHSSFVCQRCPWFEGLFHGRSNGQWLVGRREARDSSGQTPSQIKIDLKHMEADAFKYVLQYLYGDVGAELFDPAVCDSFDDFLGLVMEVMSIANYLMLDRLSQICQQVMGRFANIRNISHFLNDISPCAVTEFKEAGLEYICLQMETMLENHLLDDLDEDLLLELDEVVRDNQAARFPFAKSGRAGLLLHEKYPELAQDIDEERQIRVKEMAYKAQKEEEKKLATPYRARYGSLDDGSPMTPTPDRSRRVSKTGRNEPFSPDLRPRGSRADLMFDMDDEDSAVISSPLARPRKAVDTTSSDLDQIPPLGSSWKDTKGKAVESIPESPSTPAARTLPLLADTRAGGETSSPVQARGSGNPWRFTPLPTSKTDLRDVFQAESTHRSALSEGLAARKDKEAAPKIAHPKMSQKERKKQQQAAQAALLSAQSQSPKIAWEKASGDSPAASPWRPAPAKGRTPSKQIPAETKPATPSIARPQPAAETSSSSIHRRTASPDTRFSGQRTPSSASLPTRPPTKPNATASSSNSNSLPKAGGGAQAQASSSQPTKPLVPHSRTYLKPATKTETYIGLGLADIIGMQKREQEIVKEAVAKRSLQEIQQEQAFQEWWDAESRRTQEEEAKRLEREKAKDEGGASKARNGGRRGRPGKSRGGGGGGAGGGGRGGGEAAGGKPGRGPGSKEAASAQQQQPPLMADRGKPVSSTR
ncbi:BTB/POZ domain-containing protein 1 [Diplogelasinospora grovesii]|uniref:BTB/POZ domain-containing protein 1 n=1 Tax=Diplogelasinospora grovesii TaxID=303347 RepID=A0AAN6NIE1_9PEZI|nr:BTB/POZ domain-containing protein 1 [Diplogelasinospora grovesii]